MAGIAGLVIMTSGCSHSEPEPTATAHHESPAPSTPEAVESHTPTPAPVTIDFADPNEWAAVGTVLARSVSSQGIGAFPGEGTRIYVPGVGELAVNAADIFPGATIVDEKYASTGDDAVRIVVAAIEEMPGSGLTPAHHHARMASYSLETGTWTELSIPSWDSDRLEITMIGGSPQGVVLVQLWDDEASESLPAYGIDAHTGAIVWQQDGWLSSPTFGSVAIGESRTSNCEIVKGIDIASGKTLWSFDTRKIKTDSGQKCASTSIGDGSVWGTWLEGLSEFDAIHHVSFEYGPERWYDAHTGERLSDETDDARAYDPIGRLAFIDRDGLANDDDDNVRVVDVVTGKAVWKLDDETRHKLNFRVDALYNKKLYAHTENGTVIVDLATGDDSQTWSRYPRAEVGTWIWWSDGTLEVSGS